MAQGQGHKDPSDPIDLNAGGAAPPRHGKRGEHNAALVPLRLARENRQACARLVSPVNNALQTRISQLQ